ncbi:MAG TPA: putative molybdenum carrier protein [Candidatus Hydrogenedentes bacterium]|nr:putative molybdenum carrier protein [Candidatus Hydrogenedentota bacterium]HPG69507.1 putative molybdenum carrier protein [Candidatus Hydrogenedentota bacterium]
MATLERILSGGQTGVDLAALDVAIEKRIACRSGGPNGRLVEDGCVPDRYRLRETTTSPCAARTELNARDSDGTLIIHWAQPSEGTIFTVAWVCDHAVRVLNVAGPPASACPHLHGIAVEFLRGLRTSLGHYVR